MSKQGTPFNAAAVSRITSATAKSNGGQIPAGSFACRGLQPTPKFGLNDSASGQNCLLSLWATYSR